jgi:hypothetical protein
VDAVAELFVDDEVAVVALDEVEVALAAGVAIGVAAFFFITLVSRMPPPTSTTRTAATTPMTRPVRDFFAGGAGGKPFGDDEYACGVAGRLPDHPGCAG